MKSKIIITAIVLLASLNLKAQENKKLAYQKAKEAIELMNKGKYDESIKLLKESEKLDKGNYNYPYEIALAYTYKKEYKKAIKILKKTSKYDESSSQVFQLLGNNYSLNGDKEQALATYEEGLQKFPNSGNLYLETGNIYLMAEDFNAAVGYYEKGVEVAPKFSSNYYRLAKLFLRSTDKLAGLIYGEIFMNLERTTDRTIEVSELLFNTYNESVSLSEDSANIDLCDVIIDASSLEEGELTLPFCAIFGKNFVLSTIGQTEMNLQTLSEIRSNFIDFYFKEDSKKYPNVLLSYHKKMKEAEVFTAYNYYLFQVSNEEKFNEWKSDNEKEYNTFVEWYTTVENYLPIDQENKYLRK